MHCRGLLALLNRQYRQYIGNRHYSAFRIPPLLDVAICARRNRTHYRGLPAVLALYRQPALLRIPHTPPTGRCHLCQAIACTIEDYWHYSTDNAGTIAATGTTPHSAYRHYWLLPYVPGEIACTIEGYRDYSTGNTGTIAATSTTPHSVYRHF